MLCFDPNIQTFKHSNTVNIPIITLNKEQISSNTHRRPACIHPLATMLNTLSNCWGFTGIFTKFIIDHCFFRIHTAYITFLMTLTTFNRTLKWTYKLIQVFCLVKGSTMTLKYIRNIKYLVSWSVICIVLLLSTIAPHDSVK